MAMKIHTLFITGPRGRITNMSIDYSRGGFKWVAKVRASSTPEAKQLLQDQVASPGPGKPGIVSLDTKEGPPKNWPWDVDKDLVTPQWK